MDNLNPGGLDPLGTNLSREQMIHYRDARRNALEILRTLRGIRGGTMSFLYVYCKAMVVLLNIVIIMGNQPFTLRGQQIIQRALFDMLEYHRIIDAIHDLYGVAAEQGLL